jgi:hypothetical protein
MLINEMEKIVCFIIEIHNNSQKITTTLTTFKNIMNESNDIIEIKPIT